MQTVEIPEVGEEKLYTNFKTRQESLDTDTSEDIHTKTTETENKEEQQYLDLIRTIDQHGRTEMSRNGLVRSIFGWTQRFSLKDGQLPILTTKKVFWSSCWKELCWFIKGSTNVYDLQAQGVHIWDHDWLASGGHVSGNLGPIYGHQWRHFNSDSQPQCDQLATVIEQLKKARDPNQPYSRRIILSSWNPCQLPKMVLPPCHILCQFYVSQNRYLSCSLYQRSGDVGLGIPFNILSYAFLTHLLAHHCQLEATEFIHFIGDAHIYETHLNDLRKQTLRKPHVFPRIRFSCPPREDIEKYDIDDIEWITPYQHEAFIKLQFA